MTSDGRIAIDRYLSRGVYVAVHAPDQYRQELETIARNAGYANVSEAIRARVWGFIAHMHATADRAVTSNRLPAWTINVSGSERHDGEKPYTYAVRAKDMATAKRLAWIWHVWEVSSDYGREEAVDPYWRPNGPDVVVIDSPEFPCEEGAPFDCWDSSHWDGEDDPTVCTCDYHWTWVNGCHVPAVEEDRLRALGYGLPEVAPEETAD